MITATDYTRGLFKEAMGLSLEKIFNVSGLLASESGNNAADLAGKK